jgi:hypothetical protein
VAADFGCDSEFDASKKTSCCGRCVTLNVRAPKCDKGAHEFHLPPSGHIFMFIRRFRSGARAGAEWGSNMIFQTRDTAEYDQSAETQVEGEIREFVSRDVVTKLGRQPDNESELVASNINSVLQRASATTVHEIDKLIAELEASRDKLHSEAARVQREIIQYATFTQATLQSTKIIAESLMQWKQAPTAPTMPD